MTGVGEGQMGSRTHAATTEKAYVARIAAGAAVSGSCAIGLCVKLNCHRRVRQSCRMVQTVSEQRAHLVMPDQNIVVLCAKSHFIQHLWFPIRHI
jgi:hypothetical protein